MKDGYRLVWNRYAKKLLQLCNTPLIVKLFADKIAIAAEDISSTGKKWVDLTVFSAFASEKLRDAFTQELLKLGIDVLDNEQNITDASLLSTSEGYNYDAVGYIRYLNAGVTSKDDFQRMKREYANSLKALLSNIRREKGEHKVTESTLYLCSTEEIIQTADVNLNLEKLIPPWKECEGLHPLEGNLAVALGAIANTESEHEWTIVLDGVVDNKRLYVSQELQESISQAIDRNATRACCYNPIDGTIAVVKKENFSAVWGKTMEACIARDTWIDIYNHDLEVPGFDFVAPAMAIKHYWNNRGYSFKFEIPAESDGLRQIAKVLADYVLSEKKVHEEARTVQFTVRGAGITLEKLQEAIETAVGREKYWNYLHAFFSFEKIVSKRDDKDTSIEFEPDAVRITLKSRWLALRTLSQQNETITIDAFDAKDEAFCGYGFYEIEHAKARKLSRLVLPKGAELTDEEWQKFTNHLWFYFFDEKCKNLIFESDKEGCEKLKICVANNRKKDPYS